jgi:hypothetical protein
MIILAQYKISGFIKMVRTYSLSALLLLLSLPVFAGEVAKVTLGNGTQVVLNDDFTWEYAILEVQPQLSGPEGKQLQALTPAVTLLSSAALDGVKVSFSNSEWDGDSLGLNFDLQSRTAKNVVIVEVEATLFDDTGKQLITKSFNVWQAQYRLPETYLREGEQRPSRTVWLENINPDTWKKQLLSLRVLEVRSR